MSQVSVFNCTCLFVPNWQQFYMNHKALITSLYGLAYHFAHISTNLVQTLTCPDLGTINLPITSSSDSISTSLSLSSESLSYSSTWLKSAVDAKVSSLWNCGIAHETQHRHIGNNRAHLRGGSGLLFNLVSWKEDPCGGIRICI